MLRFRFCLGCRRWNSLSRGLKKQNDGIVRYVSVVSTSHYIFFLRSVSSSRIWVIWPSATSSFEYLLVTLSSWRRRSKSSHPPVPFHTPPHLFPNPGRRVQPPDRADRSRQRPRDQLFSLYIGVSIPWPPARETTIYLSTPLVMSIPAFFLAWALLGHERSLRDATRIDLIVLRASLFSDPSSRAKRALHSSV